MKFSTFTLVAFSAVSQISYGEIEKTAIPTDQGLKLFWWPKVNSPQGFAFDIDASHQTSTKMFVQQGRNFSNSETVIYAKAIYKPRMPEIKSLKELMDFDIAKFKGHDQSIKIAAVPSIVDGDGKELRVLSYLPSVEGNWESVAYIEEGEYYLLFTISSRSQKGFESSIPAFKAMIAGYREKP